MSKEIADSFIGALRELEENRDVEALVEIHAEDCEVGNVSVSETFRGHDGLREFWTEYRKTFGEMKSTFRNIFAAGGRVALEWVTEGTSNEGRPVRYEGVSIIEADGDSITRFRAYFDAGSLGSQIVQKAQAGG